MEAFLVAVRCPQCGAETDFPEGARALCCAYCGVALRIVGADRGGRARLLMSPTLEARALGGVLSTWARRQGRALKGVEWRALVLAPFWRARGFALRWTYYRRRPAGAGPGGDALARRAVSGGAPDAGGLEEAGLRAGPALRDERALLTRHADLSFPAFTGARLGLASLGVRPGARPLRVLAPDTLPAGATLLPAAVDAGRALTRAARAILDGLGEGPGAVVLERSEAVTTSLRIVYFPFLVASVRIDGTERLVVVDAVAGSVVREGEPTEAWFAALPSRAAPTLRGRGTGFLPLTCPECAAALPFEASAVAHLCPHCGRAWIEAGNRLAPLPYDAVPARGAACYLPSWRFEAKLAVDGRPVAGAADLPRLYRPVGWPAPPAAGAAASRPVAVYVPAFECRALSLVERLAAALTRLQPDLGDRNGPAAAGPLPLSPPPTAIGPFVDAGAAARLARLLLVGLVPGAGPAAPRRLATLEVDLGPGHLVWLPADERGAYLQDRLTRVSLPKAALGLAAAAARRPPRPTRPG